MLGLRVLDTNGRTNKTIGYNVDIWPPNVGIGAQVSQPSPRLVTHLYDKQASVI